MAITHCDWMTDIAPLPQPIRIQKKSQVWARLVGVSTLGFDWFICLSTRIVNQSEFWKSKVNSRFIVEASLCYKQTSLRKKTPFVSMIVMNKWSKIWELYVPYKSNTSSCQFSYLPGKIQRKSNSCKQLKWYFITRIANQLSWRGGGGREGGSGFETTKKLLLTNSFIRAFREQITRSGLLVLQKHIWTISSHVGCQHLPCGRWFLPHPYFSEHD